MKTTWIVQREYSDPPYAWAFRNVFNLESARSVSLEYSADERAQVFLDGRWVADGPLRGTSKTWYSERLELGVLPPGEHRLVFINYVFGKTHTAYAQVSIANGIWIGGQDLDALNPNWEAQFLDGANFVTSRTDWGNYPRIITDEDFNWDASQGRGGVWTPAKTREDERNMLPSPLPLRERGEWTDYKVEGELVTFGNYGLFRGEYELEGSGEVRFRWYEGEKLPGQTMEDVIHARKPGCPFPVSNGSGDRFRLKNQTVKWHDYWWHAGRTLQITCNGDIRVKSMRFHEVGYPWKLKPRLFENLEGRDRQLVERSWRTLQMCTCDTTMDCPYYEQLQYVGDGRIQALILYQITDDLRLQEKFLAQIMDGQASNGAIPAHYPSKDADFLEKIMPGSPMPTQGNDYYVAIPSFMAYWVMMVHDYARLKKDCTLTAQLAESARKTVHYLASCLDGNGLLYVSGWNFVDWLKNWTNGCPPHCEEAGIGCTLNLIFLRALQEQEDTELNYGSTEEADWCRVIAAKLENSIRKAYYDGEKHLYYEDLDRTYISEHAQTWAVLALKDTGVFKAMKNMKHDEMGIAFSFYYMMACRIAGEEALFQTRLDKYRECALNPKFKTMPECFPNEWWLRSECHAWSSHAMYWFAATGSFMDKI